MIKSPWDRYHALLYILFVIAGTVALVWAGLLLLVRLRGGTILGGAARMLDLFVWGLLSAQVRVASVFRHAWAVRLLVMMTSWHWSIGTGLLVGGVPPAQVVSNAATVSSPSLVPLLASFFRAAAVLQLEGVLLPPACTGAYPFESEVSLMILAVFAWTLCITMYYSRCVCVRLGRLGSLNGNASKAAVSCGRAALTAALVLYSSSASTAVSLLYCSSHSVAADSVKALDGGWAAAGTTTAGAGRGAVDVQVLVKNPYFICWEGSHRIAGIIAAITLAVYVTALPIVLLVWAWKNQMLQSQLRQSASCGCIKRDAVAGHARYVQNPMLKPASMFAFRDASLNTRSSSSTTRKCSSSLIPSQNAPDLLLQPLFGDYISSAWYTKLTDVLLLLVLALLRALVPRPTTVVLIATKAATSCTLLLAVCAHVLLVRPYVPQQAWKNWVRALLLFDSAGCALLNAAVSALDAGFGGPLFRASVPVGSYILLAFCCITLGVLLWRFVVSIYTGTLFYFCVLDFFASLICRA